MKHGRIHHRLEKLYGKYTHREYVHPDPLEFLYDYPDIEDREIVGFIASALAYGRVNQILKSVRFVLDQLGESPYETLVEGSGRAFVPKLRDFKHRFATGKEMVNMFKGIRRVVRKYGSLNACFLKGLSKTDENIIPALESFAHELGGGESHLIPCAGRGSACKRLNLFLRWMVREDVVDPGGWEGVLPSKLLIPLDTHMYKFGKALGFTERKTANLTTALEITKEFKALCPDDPVRYDFCLTRVGINGLPDFEDLVSEG